MTNTQKQVLMTSQRNTIKKYASKLSIALKLGQDPQDIITEMNDAVATLEQLIYKAYTETLSVEELIDNIVGDTPTIQDIVEETA